MNSTRSRTRSNCLVISFSAVALCTVIASAASAQATPDLFTMVETLTLSDGTPAAGTFSPQRGRDAAHDDRTCVSAQKPGNG